MTLNLDNIKLRELIPNVIHEVEGETPLYDKILPWIESAKVEMESIFLGTAYEPKDSVGGLVEKLIVNRAFTAAIPSLDLSVSPGGFTVINTEGRSPASKERVERLIASLDSYYNANANLLLKWLALDDEWRKSSLGQWWLATFIPNFDHVYEFKGKRGVMTTYRVMRDIAVMFEHELAERFLGRKFLSTLRDARPGKISSAIDELRETIVAAELKFIKHHFDNPEEICPNSHEVWHLARPIIAHLDYFPELKEQWSAEMGDIIKVEPFKNKVKGGYFF